MPSVTRLFNNKALQLSACSTALIIAGFGVGSGLELIADGQATAGLTGDILSAALIGSVGYIGLRNLLKNAQVRSG